MVGTQSRGPYNQSSGDSATDSLTFNPQADARSDNAEFDPSGDYESAQPLGARGADNQPTGRNFAQEDLETEKSDTTGKIPKGEVKDLLSSVTEEERGASGRTRGMKNDAFKQEKELDRAFVETGLADAEQDVEIGRATGA